MAGHICKDGCSTHSVLKHALRIHMPCIGYSETTFITQASLDIAETLTEHPEHGLSVATCLEFLAGLHRNLGFLAPQISMAQHEDSMAVACVSGDLYGDCMALRPRFTQLYLLWRARAWCDSHVCPPCRQYGAAMPLCKRALAIREANYYCGHDQILMYIPTAMDDNVLLIVISSHILHTILSSSCSAANAIR